MDERQHWTITITRAKKPIDTFRTLHENRDQFYHLNKKSIFTNCKTKTRMLCRRTADISHCYKRRAYIGTYGEESIFYWIFQGCRPQAFQTTSHALPVTWDSGAFYWIAFARSRVKCPKLFSSFFPVAYLFPANFVAKRTKSSSSVGRY